MDEKKEKITRTFLERLLFLVVPFLGMLYIRFVALTSRVSEYNRHIPDNLIKEGKNFIFAFWHARQFFLGYIRRNDKIKVIISESKDGEYIARVIGYFGMDTARGSTTRGGAKVLVKSLRALKEGFLIGITPDGPKGPPLSVQNGVIALAAKSGCPIIPLSYGVKRKKVLRSWDSYIIPYPFNVISATYGEPIYINENDDMVEAAKKVAYAMNKNTVFSDEMV